MRRVCERNSTCSDPSALGHAPVTEYFDILGREFGASMNLCVGPDGHCSAFHFVTDFVELVPDTPFIVATPLGQI